MRIAMSSLTNEYLLRGFIALALVFCRVKLDALVPRGTRGADVSHRDSRSVFRGS